jgi:transcriptional regulator with XRE-family HTH domain
VRRLCHAREKRQAFPDKERGERFPSAPVLRRIAGPLGLNEEELFAFASFLSPPSAEAETHAGRIDPYVAGMLASETMATQRTLVGLLYILKSIAKE